MKTGWRWVGALLLLTPLAACGQEKTQKGSEKPRSVEVRAGIDHGRWKHLLAKYVDDRGRVDYAAWKASAEDSSALRDYLGLFAAAPEPAAQGNERIASLINAYNALTVQWILSNFPTRSIQSLDASFTAARHDVAGRKISLDEIEHATLRPLAGYRIHAALSCASLSCPPLAREPFEPDRLEAQLNGRMTTWLAREDLNRFLPDQKKVEISEVFRWNLEDFQKAGGLRSVLRKFAPRSYTGFLSTDGYAIAYLPYQWGLNDQAGSGAEYGRLHFLWDKIRSRAR